MQSRNKDHIIDAIKDSDALLVMYADIDEEIQKAAKKAKIISRYGIGVNMIDVDSASRLGIMVANVNDYCVDEVSDHALSFILSSARRLILHIMSKQRKGIGILKRLTIPLEASNALVGLVGFRKNT